MGIVIVNTFHVVSRLPFPTVGEADSNQYFES